jgi:hypothetical protein
VVCLCLDDIDPRVPPEPSNSGGKREEVAVTKPQVSATYYRLWMEGPIIYGRGDLHSRPLVDMSRASPGVWAWSEPTYRAVHGEEGAQPHESRAYVTVRSPSLRTNKKLIVRALTMVCTRTKGDEENSRTTAIEVATVTKITRNEIG